MLDKGYLVNDAPVAEVDEAKTAFETVSTIDVLGNDSDEDGTLDSATVAVISAPSNGSVVVNGDGTVAYTPVDGFSGENRLRLNRDRRRRRRVQRNHGNDNSRPRAVPVVSIFDPFDEVETDPGGYTTARTGQADGVLDVKVRIVDVSNDPITSDDLLNVPPFLEPVIGFNRDDVDLDYLLNFTDDEPDKGFGAMILPSLNGSFAIDPDAAFAQDLVIDDEPLGDPAELFLQLLSSAYRGRPRAATASQSSG